MVEAKKFPEASPLELCVEVSVRLDPFNDDPNLADDLDGWLCYGDGETSKRFRSCPDKSILRILVRETNPECLP